MKTLFILATFTILFSAQSVFAQTTKSNTRNIAAVDDEPAAAVSGVFVKIDGIDGKSGVAGYDSYLKIENFSFNGNKQNAQSKILFDKSLHKASQSNSTDQTYYAPGATAYFSRKFDAKNSFLIQKLFLSKKLTTVKLAVLSSNKLTAEYSLREAFIASYAVSHSSPSSYGPADDLENITVYFSNLDITSPKNNEILKFTEQ